MIKDGYNSLVNVESSSVWPSKLCWGPSIILKASAFTLLEIKDRILIAMRLDQLGITPLFPCVMCGKAYESSDHLLLTCEFASTC